MSFGPSVDQRMFIELQQKTWPSGRAPYPSHRCLRNRQTPVHPRLTLQILQGPLAFPLVGEFHAAVRWISHVAACPAGQIFTHLKIL
jgi:hypothetical protein